MQQNDVDEDEWWTGITYYQVSYSDSANDPFNLYIMETTIPWIGIQMQGENMVRYGYSQETSLYHIRPIGYTYHNYSLNQQWTSLVVEYELDYDGDGEVEWKFLEQIEFQPPVLQPPQTGWYKIEFQIKDYPKDLQGRWADGQTLVQTIEIPFIIDADVFDTSANDFYTGVPNNWNHVHFETSCNAANINAKIANPLYPPPEEIALIVTPNPQNCFPASQLFTFLQVKNNEWAHDPADYDDDETLDANNGVVWYIESYNVQINPPPNLNNQGWTGIKCVGFVAGPQEPPN